MSEFKKAAESAAAWFLAAGDARACFSRERSSPTMTTVALCFVADVAILAGVQLGKLAHRSAVRAFALASVDRFRDPPPSP